MTKPKVKVTVERSQMLVGRRWLKQYLECHGPDGTKFTNDSLVTLRSVMKRKYPDLTLELEVVEKR